ncbi:hypothetical protein DMUE_4056 [Dictyocoela muelleri]|nr:hypothetical protein DMUE_4056 [Dictyocoela muelleri]
MSMFMLHNGCNILIYKEDRESPIVILGDIGFIAKFSSRSIFKVYMDRTFKTSPNEFYQLYIIHGEFNGECFPLHYCFLYNKTEAEYTKLFLTIGVKLSLNKLPFYPVFNRYILSMLHLMQYNPSFK